MHSESEANLSYTTSIPTLFQKEKKKVTWKRNMDRVEVMTPMTLHPDGLGLTAVPLTASQSVSGVHG